MPEHARLLRVQIEPCLADQGQQARAHDPERWSGPTRNWALLAPVVLNPMQPDTGPSNETAQVTARTAAAAQWRAGASATMGVARLEFPEPLEPEGDGALKKIRERSAHPLYRFSEIKFHTFTSISSVKTMG